MITESEGRGLHTIQESRPAVRKQSRKIRRGE